MTKATLTLEGINQISGEVETGGDYARFQASDALDESQINGPHEGQLAINGQTERVVVESYRATDDGGCEITLRRFKPEARA
ncbi:hypothetical protein [Paracoccus everestensis]|uniref:hypothetical protein n=1 Tax=Paracoccus everestensis TaxID=2903900 RepID=UPI001F2EAB10|nr:hypothetical protein [Paracoccus everestensis]